MRKSFRIGPGAASLLLVVVVVALSLLALLSFIEVHGDKKLTDRSMKFTVSEYKASANAEYSLAELDTVLAGCAAEAADDEEYLKAVAQALPEGMTMEGNIVSWREATPSGRVLLCSVKVNPLDSEARYEWYEHMFTAAESGL